MKGPEARLWERLQPRLSALGLDPVRVENSARYGTPDVNYLSGWIELKALSAWPARPATPVRFPSLEQRRNQVAFLTRRWRAGAPAWLGLGVANEFLLVPGWQAPMVRQGMTQGSLRQLAVWRKDELMWPRLRAWLTWDLESLPGPDRARLMRLMAVKLRSQVEIEGWSIDRVRTAETQDCDDTLTLLDYWLA